MEFTYHVMDDIGLSNVCPVKLIPWVYRTLNSKFGRLGHEAKLGVKVGSLFIVVQRVPACCQSALDKEFPALNSPSLSLRLSGAGSIPYRCRACIANSEKRKIGT
jgi:hypothetical protein